MIDWMKKSRRKLAEKIFMLTKQNYVKCQPIPSITFEQSGLTIFSQLVFDLHDAGICLLGNVNGVLFVTLNEKYINCDLKAFIKVLDDLNF